MRRLHLTLLGVHAKYVPDLGTNLEGVTLAERRDVDEYVFTTRFGSDESKASM